MAAGCIAATLTAEGNEQQAAASNAPSAMVECEQNGFRYSYHAPTGTEGLYETGPGARSRLNVIADHRDLARDMRRTLETKLHVGSLDELRAAYADSIRRLQQLGYL
jgi:hypothetical protein